MAFTTIPQPWIEVGQPLKQELLQYIKDDLDALNATTAVNDVITATQGDTLTAPDAPISAVLVSTSGAGTLTLPSAALSVDKKIIIKKVAGTHALTITRAGSDTIDGATTKVISAVYTSVCLISNGSNWNICYEFGEYNLLQTFNAGATAAALITEGTKSLKIQTSSVGAAAVSNDMFGAEFIVADANTTNKYTPAIKFGSTDSNFTTLNPKFGAVIVGAASESYSSDLAGAMDVEIYCTDTTPGAGGALTRVLRVSAAAATGVRAATPIFADAGATVASGQTLSTNTLDATSSGALTIGGTNATAITLSKPVTINNGTSISQLLIASSAGALDLIGGTSSANGASIRLYGSTSSQNSDTVFYQSGTESGRIDQAGAWTVGPASGAPSVTHTMNGYTRLGNSSAPAIAVAKFTNASLATLSNWFINTPGGDKDKILAVYGTYLETSGAATRYHINGKHTATPVIFTTITDTSITVNNPTGATRYSLIVTVIYEA